MNPDNPSGLRPFRINREFANTLREKLQMALPAKVVLQKEPHEG